MLINLSNHPSETWCGRQRQAAKVYGTIVDLPFPAVDPGGDEAYIERLADEYTGKILCMATDCRPVVHLMGEMTLTVVLLSRLRSEGIRCIASTSQRQVEEVDGQKQVTFILLSGEQKTLPLSSILSLIWITSLTKGCLSTRYVPTSTKIPVL